MSSNEEVDAIVANGGTCTVCQCTLTNSKSTINIQNHINGKKHKLRQKQLQFSTPLKTFVDHKVAASKLAWEDNFDENLLKKDGIIITVNNFDGKSAKCYHCLCDLPPLSISKDANVYNIKVHVIGRRHNIHSRLFEEATLLNQQNLEVNKGGKDPHHLIPLFNSALNLQNKLVGKPLNAKNVDYVFDMLEESVKHINDIEEIGFSKFHLNRQYISYSAKKKYRCLLCKTGFPIGKTSIPSYNVAVHISGRKHLNSFKILNPDDAMETKTLLRLSDKATQQILQQLIMNETVA